MHLKNCQLNSVLFTKSQIELFSTLRLGGYLYILLIDLKEGNHFKLKQFLFYCFKPKGNPKFFVKFIFLHAFFDGSNSVFKLRYRNAVSSEDTPSKTRLGGQLFCNPN